MLQRAHKILWGAAGIVLLLALWQFITAAGVVGRGAMPSAWETFGALGRQFTTADFWKSIGLTLQGWAIGVAIGVVLALVLGVMFGSSRFAFRSGIPVVELLKTIPSIAILPLAIMAFGATMKMKVFLVAFVVIWQLTIQVIYGVRAVDPVISSTARAMGVSRLRRVFLVVVPSAAPYIATGLRIAAATGLVLAVLSELVGGAPGLGLTILVTQNAGVSSLPTMYAYILTTGVVGLVVTGAFTYLEGLLLHWHESHRNRRAV